MLHTCEPCNLATVVSDHRTLGFFNGHQRPLVTDPVEMRSRCYMPQVRNHPTSLAAMLCHARHPNRRAGSFQLRTRAIGADFREVPGRHRQVSSSFVKFRPPQNLENFDVPGPLVVYCITEE